MGSPSNTGSNPAQGAPAFGEPVRDLKDNTCPRVNYLSESYATASQEVKDWLDDPKNRVRPGISQRNAILGYKGGGGFLRHTTRVKTLKKGQTLWRAFGCLADEMGCWAGAKPVRNPIRSLALPEQNCATDWAKLKVKKDVDVLVGKGAPRCSNKPGGTEQIYVPYDPNDYLELQRTVPVK